MDTSQWTDKIPNDIICNYFYVFFMIFTVWSALSLIGGIWIYATTKMTLGVLIAIIFNTLLSFGISLISFGDFFNQIGFLILFKQEPVNIRLFELESQFLV